MSENEKSAITEESQEPTPEERWELLVEKAQRLPREPGVYIMRGEKNEIIYVGKARDLRSRVRSYFSESSSDTRAFVERLEEFLFDFEFVLTSTEKEALLLENELIKKHKPRFNVMLKDDKNYLWLKIDPKAEYPWIETTRKREENDKMRHFGPYTSSSSLREMLRIINRHFLLRTCNDQALYHRKKVCLQYHIHRCLGPCVYEIDNALYASQVDNAMLFLEGKGSELIGQLQDKMKAAAMSQRYELAGHYRDQLRDIEKTVERQRVVLGTEIDCDVIGLYREGILLELHVLCFRQGRLMDSKAYPLEDKDAPTPEVLSSFLNQYYNKATDIPELVLLSESLPDEEEEAFFSSWLSEKKGKKVEVHWPQRGEKKAMIELALKNARASFEERAATHNTRDRLLERVQKRLDLAKPPERIECYDISTFQGAFSVGSMVVFTDGKPDKAQYRKFKIKLPHNGKHDDFAMMYEVLARRFRRGAATTEGGDASFARALPDLLVVDGGRGQLKMAVEVLRDLAVKGVEVVSLAKERVTGTKEDGGLEKVIDRVYMPGVKNPIPVRSESSELYLLSRCRDEAHRFAIEFHRDLRNKATLRSSLDDIPGIGPKRRTILLKKFGSVKGVGKATAKEISETLSIPLAQAEDIISHLPSAALNETDEGDEI
jgi:excinuclease ABC subunit C